MITKSLEAEAGPKATLPCLQTKLGCSHLEYHFLLTSGLEYGNTEPSLWLPLMESSYACV